MASKKSKKRRNIILLTIGLVIIGFSIVSVRKRKQVALSVETQKVERRNITEEVSSDGRILPVVQVKISPEVSGEIIKLPVTEGQDVRKGELLLQIKPELYQAAVEQAQASFASSQAGLAQAEANLANSEFEHKRTENLFKTQSPLVSESEYFTAQTALKVSQAQAQSATHQVEISRAMLRKAQEDLAKTTISSPLNGTVSKLNSELGERVLGTAQNMGTEIMVISDLTQMEARVDIGEIDIVLIKIGQKATLEVDAFRDRKFTGQVSEIGNTANASGQGTQQQATKFEVKIRVLEQEAFRPGMSVTADIETRYRTNIVAVPFQSVTSRMPKPDKTKPESPDPKEGRDKKPNQPVDVVFVVEGDHAKMVEVERGISDDEYVEILAGLEEGVEVVSGGYKVIANDLQDGMSVKVSKSRNKQPGKGD